MWKLRLVRLTSFGKAVGCCLSKVKQVLRPALNDVTILPRVNISWYCWRRRRRRKFDPHDVTRISDDVTTISDDVTTIDLIKFIFLDQATYNDVRVKVIVRVGSLFRSETKNIFWVKKVFLIDHCLIYSWLLRLSAARGAIEGCPSRTHKGLRLSSLFILFT